MNKRIGLLRKPYRMFNHFAPFYEWLVTNDLWRESVREMARHLPPSGAVLRLLDVGCGPANSARRLIALRPDIHITALDASPVMMRRAAQAVAADGQDAQARIQLALADAARLPAPTASMDAVFVHSVYYMMDDQPAFLAEAFRVLRPGGRLIMLDPARVRFPFGAVRLGLRALPSVLIWQSVSRAYRRFTPSGLAQELSRAGFARVLGESAVHGYGILSRGEKPYPFTGNPHAQAAGVAAANGPEADALEKARFVFLLIRETPHKPAWARTPNDVITWGAASALDSATGQPHAIAFTSLPKAVAFMQPAVTTNRIKDVTRVAKFPAAERMRWEFPLIVNPPLSLLDQEPGAYTLPGPFLGVDPISAVTGEE
jgi:ubiquinone/menaquinone biosynthesis C-methylase UbiE